MVVKSMTPGHDPRAPMESGNGSTCAASGAYVKEQTR